MKKTEKQIYEGILEKYNYQCAICGNNQIHLHHIFGGKNRKKSTIFGYIVPLCEKHHRWVHNTNYQVFKKEAQRDFEKEHTREEFIRVFGRNYLE